MLGGLYGLTGASFALLRSPKTPAEKNRIFNPGDLSALLGGINNPVDSGQVLVFKTELQYLIDYLKGLEYAYTVTPNSGEQNFGGRANKLNAQILRMERGDPAQQDFDKLAELRGELQSLLDEGKVRKIVSGGMLASSVNRNVSLSDDALAVLAMLKEFSVSDLEKYTSLVSDVAYVQMKAFNEYIFNIASKSTNSLLRRIGNYITDLMHDSEKLREGLQSSVAALRANFSSASSMMFSDRIDNIEIYLDEAQEVVRQELRDFGLALDLFGGLSATFNDRYSDFRQSLISIASGSNLSPDGTIEGSQISKIVVDALIKLFKVTFRLDNDVELLNELLFQGKSKKTLKEIEYVFSTLNDAGFFMLHLDNNLLFLERLKVVTLDSYGRKTSIVPTHKESGDMFDFAEVAELANEYSRSLVNFGENLFKR